MMNRSMMLRTNISSVCLAVVVGILVCCGCGQQHAASGMAKATGTITFQNSPVDGANVTFYPAGGESKLVSQAITDAAGKFQLATQTGGGKSQLGVAPGKYEVSITKLDTSSVTSTLTPPKNLLPAKYANPKTSKLTADVKSGDENNFEFALKTE
jgi:hypothetical protein